MHFNPPSKKAVVELCFEFGKVILKDFDAKTVVFTMWINKNNFQKIVELVQPIEL